MTTILKILATSLLLVSLNASQAQYEISNQFQELNTLLNKDALLINQIQNVTLISTPKAAFVNLETHSDSWPVSISNNSVKDKYFNANNTFHLNSTSVLTFISQWELIAEKLTPQFYSNHDNSTTDLVVKPILNYTTLLRKTSSHSLKSLSKVIAGIIVFLAALRYQIYAAFLFIISSGSSTKEKLDLVESKLKHPKKIASALGSLLVDNIVIIVVGFLVLDSSLKTYLTWDIIEPSSHSIPASFTEFQDEVVPNCTISKVILDLHESTAFVYVNEWHNDTNPLLSPIKKFYFPFLSASSLEDKLEDIVKALPLSERFAWSVVEYKTMSKDSSFFGLPLDLLAYVVISIAFLQLQRGFPGIVGNDFMKVETDVPVRFKDVAGLDEAKGEISEIVDILKNPKKYSDMGAKMPKGVLMSGPSGTGKTLLAKAIAGEANCSFLSLCGSSFDEVYVGVGSSRVRKLFQQARNSAPCIIFIDEIDALGHRGKPNGESSDTTLNQLLVEMDGFPTSITGRENIVIVMAATNRPQLVDSALKRPGRFDRHVTVALPDRNGRRDIFKVHLEPIKLDLKHHDTLILPQTDEKSKEETERGASDETAEKDGDTVSKEESEDAKQDDATLEATEVEPLLQESESSEKSQAQESSSEKKSIKDEKLNKETKESTVSETDENKSERASPNDTALIEAYAEKLSRITTGFSGADIKNICNEAAILACRKEESSVTFTHFDLAIERVIAGLAKLKNNISPREKEILAHHEAGHATIAYFVKHSDPLVKVSIVPRSGVSEDGGGGQTLGFAQYSPTDRYLLNKEEIMDKMCVALGGRISEQVFFNCISSGAQDDLQKVTKLAYWQVQSLGFSEDVGWLSFQQSPNQGRPYGEETANLMDSEARKLVLKARERTLDLMTKYKEQVQKVALFLLEKEVMVKKDMEDLLGPRPFEDEEQNN